MSNDWRGPEDEDDDDSDFTSTLDDAELTGKDPRFFKHESLNLSPAEVSAKRVDELIEMYIETRNQLATDRKGYKDREAKMKGHMAIISMILRDRGDMAGVDSFSSPKGTAYRNKKTTYRVGDWTALSEWVLHTGNIHVLQKRVSPNAVKEVQDTESGPDTPFVIPGVEPFSTEEFAVRSPTARKSK